MTDVEPFAFWAGRAVSQAVDGMRLEGFVLSGQEVFDLKRVVDGSLSIEDYVRQGFERTNGR